ncbi:peptidase [Streptococcus chenjunshii]|uniref:Peptidase n=1 Tax=Streptococcus chenjunshii TaxID=2173853 RepID=A0A372KQG3_9STRE|nr:CppA N-terminal domain-containing protein [Streptococcus chenjunshii]AXQ77956.1 peptidase [Streptococcus chenjunshii]RFU51800.1 peptidase [Streptococcus chenjunshii]RFU53888.1 peptidase [Streptococcus chenjunshii]
MTLSTPMTFKTIALRVDNRDQNIAFYQQTLGLRLLGEENTVAFFSAWNKQDQTLIIEESPAPDTRAVRGRKKLGKIVIKAEKASDIADLLAGGAAANKIYKGKNGYAFEALSPQGDLFLLHAEDSLADLKESAPPAFLDKNPDFQGLTAFHFEQLILNVADPSLSQAFYHDQLLESFPLKIAFTAAKGADLDIDPSKTWDIEYLEIAVRPDYDLAKLKKQLENRGQTVYLDKKEKLLVVSDPSQIEVWFSK